MSPSASTNMSDWQAAQRTTGKLKEQLSKIRKQKLSDLDLADFEALEKLMENIRLPCVKIIFSDLKYAEEVQSEAVMWQSHSSVSKDYRNLLSKLKGSAHAVERRKVEKMYQNFLRTSIAFYKGYIQRLNARYEIPELRRVAQGASLKLPDPEQRSSNVSVTERRIILESCYSTLVRMGDLARYKTQLHHGRPGPEGPMTFYSLAQDLKPESGFAAHQMGVASMEEDHTFDMLYHFYRSMALKTPHPHARKSLEATFKTIGQRPKSGQKPKPNPFGAFQDWFTKLHWFYYKGEAFTQQFELEREVFTLLDRAAKDPQSNELLFKMALINMASYYFACAQYEDTRSENAQNFGGFVLSFNVKFITVICTTLEAALRESHLEHRESLDGSQKREGLSTVQVLAPLLRTCCIWLAACRNDIFALAQAHGDAVPKMMETLSRVFTLLVQEIDSVADLQACPYLLSEDLEVLGFEPLSKDRIPEGCIGFCAEDGTVKPYYHEGQDRFDLTRETQSRILDILRCAYFFSNDETVPLQHRVTERGLVFDYASSVPVHIPTQIAEATPKGKTAAIAELGSSSGLQAHPPQHLSPPSQLQTPKQVHEDLASEFKICDSDREHLSAHDYHAQETVMNMLAEVLRPSSPENDPEREAQNENDSYGMHTATANEVFASFHTNSALPPATNQPSTWGWPQTKGASPQQPAQSRQLPSLPSLNFAGDASQGGDPFAASNSNSPRGEPSYSTNPASAISWSTTPDVHRQNLLRSFTKNSTSPRTANQQWNSTSNNTQPSFRNGVTTQWQADVESEGWNVPISSAFSRFSEASSLYQGTPAQRTTGNGYRDDAQKHGQS